MAETDLALFPSHPLVRRTQNPPFGMTETPDPFSFILFGREWLKMQTYIKQTLALPISTAKWDDAYGSFPDKDKVTGVLKAMRDVQGMSNEFGDPDVIRKLISKDPEYLNREKPPAELYGHIVWVAGKVSSCAGSFSDILKNLYQIIGDNVPEKERAKNFRELLVGRGGLVTLAEASQKKVAAMRVQLGTFDGKLTDANKRFTTYTGSSSEILKAAKKLVAEHETSIAALKAQADTAYDEWKKYTIAAVSASVGLVVISGGILWPVAAGVGGGLGYAAEQCRKLYNQLMEEVEKKNVDTRKKSRLVTDLTSLNTSVKDVPESMAQFKKELETIQGVWTNISMKLAEVAKYSDKELGNKTWIEKRLKIVQAVGKWDDIRKYSDKFIQKSQVSFPQAYTWGQKLPSQVTFLL
ncbi:alpha-xenorhabdolysin family binary toxin subunit A [Streptomyces sp. NPDC001262]|uniref:alpha-xenorhabdolysin family binary toxin subunit A n=1 Tax=Streptomyces sp. NPDC001262 TaxID=3364552 RepID=UPI00368CE614